MNADNVSRQAQPRLFLVIPCYNETAVLPHTIPLFLEKCKQLKEQGLVASNSRILFVDDGSTDETWSVLEQASQAHPEILAIRQSRNRGHQNALLAGLLEARHYCDITVSIDCDGQDDLNVIEEMVQAYIKGYEVVYGVRSRRDSDTRFKRVTAQSFYRLMQHMGVEVVYNHADYRLVSSRVLNELAEFKEVNLFLRGLIPLVGFPSTEVYYERHERMAGKSHYPLRKMLALALNGITGLSVRPLRLITALGFFVSILSFLGVIWSIVAWATGHTVSGWASTIAILCFMSGIQLLSLGVLGEYIGKIYLETKARPRYILSEETETMQKEREAHQYTAHRDYGRQNYGRQKGWKGAEYETPRNL